MTLPRLRSLDLARGLTVAAMIVVNSPGRDEGYALLRHAPWNGLSGADFVFPAFLVVLGAAAAAKPAGGSWTRELKRAALLFGLGLLSNAFVADGPGGIRVLGVLQRIAFCSLGVAAALRSEVPAAAPCAAAALLLLHAALLRFAPVPGAGAGGLAPFTNLSGWIDRAVLGGRVGEPWGDPEGLLSTLSALATALLGAWAGARLRRDGPAGAARLAAAGAGLCAAGFAWSLVLPLNKRLWTGSYALATGGACVALLAACAAAVDARAARWARPVEALGRRALSAYVLTGLAYGIQEYIPATLPDGRAGNLKLLLTRELFEPWLSARPAAAAYAFAFAALAVAVANALQRGHGIPGVPEQTYEGRKEAL